MKKTTDKTPDKKNLVMLYKLCDELGIPHSSGLYTIRRLKLNPIYITELVDLYNRVHGTPYKAERKRVYLTKQEAQMIIKENEKKVQNELKIDLEKQQQSKQAEETGLIILRDILDEYGLSKEYGLKALDKLNIPRRYINTTRSVYYSKSDCRREVPTKMCAVTPDEADKVRQVIEQKGTYNKTKQKNINRYDGDLLKKVKAHYKQIQLKPTPHYIVKRYDVPMSKAARICAILNNGG